MNNIAIVNLTLGYPGYLHPGFRALSVAVLASQVSAGGYVVDELDTRDIAATLKGEGEAWLRLIRRYQDSVIRIMWRFCRERNRLEELVQDVFVEAYLSLRRLRSGASFFPWLRKIATRAGYRYWKEAKRERQMHSVDIEDLASVLAAPEETSAVQAGRVVSLLLGRLSPKDRLVLTLLYLEGMSIRDVAEATGWTEALVKVRSFRARKKLKPLIEESGKEKA